MWKKRILPLLCALALLAGLLPGRVQAAQTKPVRYLTVTGTPAQLETGRRLPQATPELASDAGAALHLTQGHWYNSITALQQGDPLPDGASVFGTGTYYLGLELKADDQLGADRRDTPLHKSIGRRRAVHPAGRDPAGHLLP
ncbi:MAG: hypothetical protein V8S89_06320 [Oscillospiraceae bacterium]